MCKWSNSFRRACSRSFLPGIILLLGHSANAQLVGDTLQSVEIRSYKKQEPAMQTRLRQYAPGQKIIRIDTATLQQYNQQSLATMLAQQIPVFVKSYGFNSISTLNFRGASAAQSQVLWEGIPLQNAASGIADVSLMPVALLDEVRAVYGSSAALLGSGNVGGAVLLEHKPSEFFPEKSSSLTLGGGSFRLFQLGYKGSWTTKRFSISLKLFGQTARNNFRYSDEQGREKQMSNDSLSSRSGMMYVAYKMDDYNIISVQAWIQDYFRQIPPALFESYSVKSQQDKAIRFLANWDHNRKQQWHIKTAYLQDQLKYSDSAIHLESNSITHHFFAEASWEKLLNQNQRFLLFTPVQLLSFNGAQNHQQTKFALAGAFHQSFFQKKINGALNGRAEMINGKAILLPGVNASYNATSWLKVQGNLQRTYRHPTLNELYYNPGGNADLKPEQGWHMDGGYSLRKTWSDHVYFEHNGSVYSRRIKDWIIWLGGAIWTPHNLAEVHSRGLETENKFLFKTGKITWNLNANGSYTRATSTKSYLAGDNSIGKQIPYTPDLNGQINIGLSMNWFDLNINHTYTGYRYITTDESQFLQPYNTTNIRMSVSGQRKNLRARLEVQCQNIGDQQYEVVGFRSMPGRNWLIGLTLSANKD